MSGLSWMVTGLMAMMAIILIANVLFRYVFGFSLTWSAEAARYCMIWFAFLGITVLTHHREHLSVTFLAPRLEAHGQKILRGTILCGFLILFAILSVFGGILVIRTGGQTAASIPWLPMNLVYAVIPLSGMIMTLSTVYELSELIRNNSNDT